MKKNLILVVISLLLISCDNKSNKLRISALENKVDSLNKEIEMYKNSPDKLYAKAKMFFISRDLQNLKDINIKLKTYTPETSICKSVDSLYTELTKQINDSILKINKIRQDSIAKIEKEKLLSVSKLAKKYDDVNGITWYEPKTFTHYNNENLTSLYIGKKSGSTWLILKMSYSGDDWIFFENAYLSYDGNTINIPFDEYSDKKTDNDGEVWEWIEISPNDEIIAFMRKMVNGKSIKMRLSGKYTRTRNLSAKEVTEIRDALMAYDILKNK